MSWAKTVVVESNAIVFEKKNRDAKAAKAIFIIQMMIERFEWLASGNAAKEPARSL